MAYRNLFGELESAMPILLAEHGVPGLSIAVVDSDDAVWLQGFGFTDVNKKQKVTPDTLFSVQSISKTCVALGFLAAVDSGLVSLDDRVKTYIPGLRVRSRDNQDYAGAITFRHLLSHRSGLPHEAPLGNNYAFADFERHVESILDVWLRHPPGERYSYSNLGFDLIGYVLQVISNRPFEDYMKEKVFRPLGMERSTFSQSEFVADGEGATGHIRGPIPKVPIPMLAAGGMYSSAREMAIMVSFLMTGGGAVRDSILRPETLALMYASRPSAESEHVYCLGVDVGLFKGSLLVNHNGGGFGFIATMDALLDERLGVVALTNSVNHPNIQLSLSRRILADLVDIRQRGQTDCKPPADSVYGEYMGLYEAPYNGGISRKSITLRNGELCLGSERITRHSDRLFFTDDGESVEFGMERAAIANVHYDRMPVYSAYGSEPNSHNKPLQPGVSGDS